MRDVEEGHSAAGVVGGESFVKLSYGQDDYLMPAYNAARVFAAALHLRFEEQRRLHPRLTGLSVFDVDKMMRLFYKVWEARPDLATRSGTSDLLRSLPVYPDYNDKHGHRVAFANVKARPQEQKYTPVLDVIAMFDRKGPPASRMLATVQGKDGYVMYVPQTTPTDLTREVNRGFLLQADIAFVQELSRVASSLTERQVIAVGRHEHPKRTEDSLVWELDRWREWTFAGLDALDAFCAENGRAPSDEVGQTLWQSWSFALECTKKAGVDLSPFPSDGPYYAEAYRMLSEKPIGPLFLETHLRRDQIWGDPRISTKGLAAYSAWACSTYLCGTLRPLRAFRDTRLASALGSVDDEEIERSRVHLRKIHGLLPAAAPAHFDVTWLSSISPDAQVQLPHANEVFDEGGYLSEFASTIRALISAITKKFITPRIDAGREEN
jgi:hypothetical protein